MSGVLLSIDPLPEPPSFFSAAIPGPAPSSSNSQRFSVSPRTTNARCPSRPEPADCSFLKLALKTGMFKLQAIFHDGSVGMEFMTEDSSEAEEMRQLLACV
jgi:hypothetical protein